MEMACVAAATKGKQDILLQANGHNPCKWLLKGKTQHTWAELSTWSHLDTVDVCYRSIIIIAFISFGKVINWN